MRNLLIFFLICGLTITALTSFKTPSDDSATEAPEFTLQNIDGEEVSLSDFNGKVVYLDFWASWCKPCIASMKDSKKLHEKYEDNEDVVFLYVSIDKNEDSWKETVQDRGIKGVNLISRGGTESNILKKYQLSRIPRYMLIDKEGNIAKSNAKQPGEPGVEAQIDRLL